MLVIETGLFAKTRFQELRGSAWQQSKCESNAKTTNSAMNRTQQKRIVFIREFSFSADSVMRLAAGGCKPIAS
jgi:hypothetical protein